MSVKDIITAKLNDALTPVSLEVLDESDNHRGHGGWREGGETHFRVRIASSVLDPLSRLERHRRINEILAEELAGRVHALAIEVKNSA